MNEQLAAEINALLHQRSIFENDLIRAGSDASKQALQAEIATVDAKIAQKRDMAAAVETEIQATQSAIIEAFDQIVVDGQAYTLRDFTINEQFAQVLSYWIQLKVGEVAQQYSAQAQSYKSENEDLIDLMDERDARIAFLSADNDRLGLQNADLQAKLDASANRTLEAEEENARLTTELKQLRENTAPKPSVTTNTGGNLGELMKAALNSRPAIYNYVNHGFNKNSAILAETGEAITFIDIEKGKYRIVSEQEALQFRTTTAEVEEVAVPDIPLADSVEPPPFQSEVPDTDNAVEGVSADGEVAQEARTIEERLARLEAAVFGR